MQTVSDFYKEKFGQKVYKISLDLGCTCPTRDGTLGNRGCIFCSQSGSGDFAADRILSIEEQVEQAKEKVNRKFSRSSARGEPAEKKYIAYFQNFTNTYGNTEVLMEKYKRALSCKDVVGLALGTRPDCIKDDILQGLAELSENYYVQIELGLQSVNEDTAVWCRRGFANVVYEDAVRRITEAGNSRIHIVTHLIFGLPGDSEKDMMEGVKEICRICGNNNEYFGIKITALYILKNTDLVKEYETGNVKALEEDEYLVLIEKALKLFPDNLIIHRLTGDPPKSLLIAPQWTTNKREVLNRIQKLLKQQNCLES